VGEITGRMMRETLGMGFMGLLKRGDIQQDPDVVKPGRDQVFANANFRLSLRRPGHFLRTVPALRGSRGNLASAKTWSPLGGGLPLSAAYDINYAWLESASPPRRPASSTSEAPGRPSSTGSSPATRAAVSSSGSRIRT